MKIGDIFLPRRFFVFGILSMILTTSCTKSNNEASAVIPATPAAYPPSTEVPASSDSWDYPSSTEEKAPPAPTFKPFVLRDGETLVKHKAQKGENLWKIARTYGTSVSRIKSANALSSDKILANKTYEIPTRKSASEISTPSIASTSTPEPPVVPPSTTNRYSPPKTTSSYTPPKTTSSYNPPSNTTSTGRPTFAPRDMTYSGPKITPSPGRGSTNTNTIPTTPSNGSSGSAVPSPSFGSGSSY